MVKQASGRKRHRKRTAAVRPPAAATRGKPQTRHEKTKKNSHLGTHWCTSDRFVVQSENFGQLKQQEHQLVPLSLTTRCGGDLTKTNVCVCVCVLGVVCVCLCVGGAVCFVVVVVGSLAWTRRRQRNTKGTMKGKTHKPHKPHTTRTTPQSRKTKGLGGAERWCKQPSLLSRTSSALVALGSVKSGPAQGLPTTI